jgi:hypothetical protein
MCEVRSRKNGQEPKKKQKEKYSGQQQKEIDCDEPHPAPNEKTQPIRWTERPTGALVAVNSLCPLKFFFEVLLGKSILFSTETVVVYWSKFMDPL